MALRFVDLFCGIGGFHQAVVSAFPDAKCVLACDIDLECQEVYEDNFGVRPFGDIKVLTECERVEVPSHDILFAGFPCQPFSKSGHQQGINETRGTLFYNILRVLEARRPRYVLLENVRNLAGPRHRETWATIIRNLRDLGYRVADEPTVMSPHRLAPHDGGAPQARERVFIVAEFVGGDAAAHQVVGGPVLLAKAKSAWNPSQWRIEDLLEDDARLPHRDRYALRPAEMEWLDTWNAFIQSLDVDKLPGFPIWADGLVDKAKFDETTPAWKRSFLIKNSEFYRANRKAINGWRRRYPRFAEFPPSRRKFEWQAQDGVRDVWSHVIHLRPSGIRVKQGNYLPALVAITQTSIIGWRKRRITPREAARLQGFSDAFRLHPTDAVAYRQLGNAVNVGVATLLIQNLVQNGVPLERRPAIQSALFEEAS